MSWLGSIEERVFPLVTGKAAAHRGRRAASGCRAAGPEAVAIRARRGLLMLLPLAWRRGALGTNHIAAHGVWRAGTRRCAPRRNRSGETRWHLCRRTTPALSVPGHQQQGASA